MEEYLHNMKTLRSQMNDVEEQAAMISVDEQTQITSIHTMELDLNSAKSETKRLKEDTERMLQAKGKICSQILERQKKIASLESDSSTLFQTLELLEQERISLHAKVQEKRAYYAKSVEDLRAKLQERQDWIKTNMNKTGAQGKPEENDGAHEGDYMIEDDLIIDDQEFKDLRTKLEAMKAELEEIRANKSKLLFENRELEQSIQQLKSRVDGYPPELGAMDINGLTEEHKALLSDKAEETEYLQSLQHQISKLKGITHIVHCECGVQYKLEMMEACG
ncbi:hypothetical protein MKW94_018630 [Papaver nudicaule]|uniref:Uncharacterized protein n=1 Tax=Papaver nudicaule TaxID=74823 RepID=A0AA41VB19_PAPNU|nr:hypothetical protein [Papaver nudicaule]